MSGPVGGWTSMTGQGVEERVDVTSSRTVPDRAGSGGWAADAATLARCLRDWHDAEGRVYGLVLTAPELYELSLELVRAVADELGSVTTEAGLVQAYTADPEIVGRVAAARGVDLRVVDVTAVAGASFCLRHGELVAAHAHQAAQQRVSDARAAGQSWATLHESGALPEPGSFTAGYHLVEASLDVPWGLHGSITFDLEDNAMVYLVEPVAVDVAEASWWLADSPPVPAGTYADLDAWREALDDMRAALVALQS
jgi:hypothetical protein